MTGFQGLIRVVASLFFFFPYEAEAWQTAGNQRSPSVGESPVYTVYFVGDAGKNHKDGRNLVFSLLADQLAGEKEESAVVFLGDNIYPKGMPGKGHKHRKEAEAILSRQLETVKSFPGKVFMIPGNHDWKKGKRSGWEYLNNQERFAEALMDSANIFLPDDGCPGPVEISLNDEITLIILDTQWILHPWEKPREDEGCDITSNADIMLQIDDIIRKNKDKKIIFSAHHLLYSYGIHGGVSNLSNHLFPLRTVNKSLYIPLPVIGSVFPLYRKWIGHTQDIKHPTYKAMRQVLTQLFARHPNLIYASGHEHSMQYIFKDSVHYIVSGAGSKSGYVKQKGYARYANSDLGFARLLFYRDGRVNLEMWQIDEQGSGKKTYEKHLFTKAFSPPQAPDFAGIDFSDSLVTTNASDQYDHKKRWLLGKNYREAWKAKITVPVFDIARKKGGLIPVKRGGGQQTRSLRLQARDGRQYVLRSIEKYTEKLVPEPLRGTIAADIVQDEISASHPYAALVIPTLAKAARIYHTNPKIVFIPEDRRLGKYSELFANRLFLFEAHPAGDQSNTPNFGNSKRIYNTAKMLKQLYKSNANQVDQLWTLKSRLFDMVIGDWDRHDDQWRWASFEHGRRKIFRPIPRDRDQAFFVNQGLLMKFAKRKWALPSFQGFNDKYKYVPGFNFNARYFDRDFLNEPSLDDWLKVADTLQKNLTDSVIEQAVMTWPDAVYTLNGEEVTTKLKLQRNNLKDYARLQYLFLARAVNVRGSNKNEFFNIERLNDLETRVRMFRTAKDDTTSRKLYDRTFKTGETKEIRVYGLGGNDLFKIVGRVKKGPVIRVIGGDGKDKITDLSQVQGLSKKNKIYDTRSGNTINFGRESRDFTSNAPEVNAYDRKDFRYDKLSPMVFLNANRDDGLFIGGGFMFTRHGFRKEPFKSQHLMLGSYALATNSFDLRFHNTFQHVLDEWNLHINFDLFSPRYISNFFGLGNETVFNKQAGESFNVSNAIDFYRIQYNLINNEVLLSKRLGEFGTLSFGHHWQLFKVEEDYSGEDRIFLEGSGLNLDENFFNWKSYEGGVLRFGLDMRDDKKLPTRGINLNMNLGAYAGLNENSNNYASAAADFSVYFTFRLPAPVTMAIRTGAGRTFGDYEFYQAQQLGGLQNLRGYRKTRFFGDSRLYNNTELRMRITTIRNPLLPVNFGFNLFNDIGRVWLDGENSDKVHHGYGGGLWFAPVNATVIAFEVAKTEEETGFYLRLGYLF